MLHNQVNKIKLIINNNNNVTLWVYWAFLQSLLAVDQVGYDGCNSHVATGGFQETMAVELGLSHVNSKEGGSSVAVRFQTNQLSS